VVEAPTLNGAEYVVPPDVGSEPSVVKAMWSRPEPPSLAASAIVTGALVVQPLPHGEPSQDIELVGAVPSAVIETLSVKVSPALLCPTTSTDPGSLGVPE
jgi:hypothetical protein